MAQQRDYLIRFREKGLDELQGKTKRLDGAFAGMRSRLTALAGTFGVTFGAAGAVALITKSTQAAIEQEDIFRKLQTSIELTGRSYAALEGDLQKYFTQLQRTTQYGDTDSAQALTTLVQLTSDYDKAIKALPITLDLASSGLFDMQTSARNVALAMEGNIMMLARYIPELRAENNELLKNATAAEKAEIAMRVLNEKFGGAAQENVKSSAGTFRQLANEIGDLSEKLGDLVLGGGGGILGMTVISLQNLNEWLGKNGTALGQASQAALAGLPGLNVFSAGMAILGWTTEETNNEIERLPKVIDTAGRKLIWVNEVSEDTAKRLEMIAEKTREINALSVEEWLSVFVNANSDIAQTSSYIDDIVDSMQQIETISVRGLPEMADGWDAVRSTVERTGDIIGDSIYDQLRNGVGVIDSFKNAFLDMLADISAELLQRTIIWSFLSLLPGGAVAGTGFSSFGSFIMGAFGGGNASLQAPSAGGGPVQNAPTVINIHAVDAPSFERFLRERGGGQAVANVMGELL